MFSHPNFSSHLLFLCTAFSRAETVRMLIFWDSRGLGFVLVKNCKIPWSCGLCIFHPVSEYVLVTYVVCALDPVEVGNPFGRFPLLEWTVSWWSCSCFGEDFNALRYALFGYCMKTWWIVKVGPRLYLDHEYYVFEISQRIVFDVVELSFVTRHVFGWHLHWKRWLERDSHANRLPPLVFQILLEI